MDTSSLLMIAAALIAVIAVYLKSPKAAEDGVGAGLSADHRDRAAHGRGVYTCRFGASAWCLRKLLFAGWGRVRVIVA